MPLYEYECKKCGNRSERIEKLSAVRTCEKCPKCGGRVERLMSAPAIRFKGSGWYVNDYARSSPGNTPSKEDGASQKAVKQRPMARPGQARQVGQGGEQTSLSAQRKKEVGRQRKITRPAPSEFEVAEVSPELLAEFRVLEGDFDRGL